MLVLRTAREVTATKLGQTIDQVRPETPIVTGGQEILEDLYERILEILSEEQSLDPHYDLAETNQPPALKELGLKLSDEQSTDVATVATVATRAAVKLLLGHRLDVPAKDLDSKLHFASDLEADSLTRVDLVLLLEEALEVSVPDDSMSLVQTVGDAELFSVLFDRTREEIILSLGEEAEELALDTPLEKFGDRDGEAAIAAATRAVGSELPQCRCHCHTLKDAVRLAFLADKIREVLAQRCGVEIAAINGDTIPEQDLGLSHAELQEVLGELALALDIDTFSISKRRKPTVAATVRALADASIEAAGGSLR